jgi:hypothetical protein
MSMTEHETTKNTLYQLEEKLDRGHWGDIQMFEDDDSRYSIAVGNAISAIKELEQYEAIGTVSEFRELKEKATAKKPIVEEVSNGNYSRKTYRCPTCKQKLILKIDGGWCGGTLSKHCGQCGTAVGWSEGKE